MKDNVPKVLQNLKYTNKTAKVKLRFRRSGENTPYLLYLDYYEDGNRKTKSLNLKITGNKSSKIADLNILKIAEVKRSEYERKVLEGETGVLISNSSKVDFLKFFEEFYNKKYSDTNYRISYDHFRRFYKKDKLDINKINYAFCDRFKDYLLSLNIKRYTAQHYFAAFKATLNYAIKREIIESNPAKYINIKYERKSIERLTEIDLKNLKKTNCKYNDLKYGFLFACFTGLRFSDINNLEFSDIESDRIRVMVKKTLNEVEIPLNRTALGIFNHQRTIRKDNYVFHIPTGGKTSVRLKKWVADAEIEKDISFHVSRHTFGCLLVERDVSLFTVKKLMGHKTVDTTLKYVNKANVKSKEAIDKLPVI